MTTPRPYLSNDHLYTLARVGDMGNVFAFPINSKDICFCTNGRWSSDFAGPLTVRKVDYRVGSVHAEFKDGQWTVTDRYNCFGRMDKFGEYASPSAKKALCEALASVAAVFAQTFPEKMAEAEYIAQNNAAHNAECDIEKAEKALEDAKAALAAINVPTACYTGIKD